MLSSRPTPRHLPLAAAYLLAAIAGAGCGERSPSGGEAAEPVTAASSPGAVQERALDLRLSELEPTQVVVGDDLRAGVEVLPPATREVILTLPDTEPVLRFVWGAEPTHWRQCVAVYRMRVTVEVVGAEAGPQEALHDRLRRPVPRWRAALVDLAPWAGQRVSLRFETSTEGSSDEPCQISPVSIGDVRVVSGPTELAGDERPPDLWVVIVDAMRADHLGYLGASFVDTPRLDGLADESLFFTRAHAPSSWTVESVSSMMSGSHYSTAHPGRRQMEDYVVPGHVPSVVEHLRANGYRTTAVLANSLMHAGKGVARGYEAYAQTSDPVLLDRLDELLAEADPRRPRLVYVHFLGTHGPLVFHEDLTPRHLEALSVPTPWPETIRSQGSESPGEERDRVRAYYRAEAEMADRLVGQILDRLDGPDADRPTWLVFAADHGEELWDHGAYGHGHNLYEELLHVPLVVRPPAGHPLRDTGSSSDAPVSLVDVGHTLVDVAGLGAWDTPSGVSLTPWLRGEAPEAPARTLLALGTYTGPARVAILRRDAKQILTTREWGRETESFDLATDPGEGGTESPAIDDETARAFLAEWGIFQRLAITGECKLRIQLEPNPGEATSVRVSGIGGLNVIRVDPASGAVVVRSPSADSARIDLEPGAGGPVAILADVAGLREAAGGPMVEVLVDDLPVDPERVAWPTGSQILERGARLSLPWERFGDDPSTVGGDGEPVARIVWDTAGEYSMMDDDVGERLREQLRAIGYLEQGDD